MLKKKRFIPQLSEITPNNEEFAHLLESVNTSHVKEGMVVKGQVVETNSDVIVVDVGLKTVPLRPSTFSTNTSTISPTFGNT